MASANPTAFKRNRLETGLAKPSIFSALPHNRIFRIPLCFPADIMHLVTLNIPDIFFELTRGTLACDKDDSKDTWDWICFKGDVWKTHGQAIADVRSYLPGSFDRPPRYPAEKLNSGYKEIEYLTYFYGLGPAMFRNILPDKYWLNYCKLVRAVQILHQCRITIQEIKNAQELMIAFIEEYEKLYYQRIPGRLHMVRQSIHALFHMAPKTGRIGPYIILSQWVMERLIGELVGELRQPSNPYQNLSQRAFRRAQLSALKVMGSSGACFRRLLAWNGIPRCGCKR